jgi:transcriptional regulatory protein LevR
MANDPALLQRNLGRERTMFETGATAMGGSKTADNLADIADVEQFDYGLIANLLSNPKVAAAQAIPTILNVAQGRNTATRAQIAQMLLGRDMKSAIAPALAAETRAGPRRAIMEAIVRGLPRPATN